MHSHRSCSRSTYSPERTSRPGGAPTGRTGSLPHTRYTREQGGATRPAGPRTPRIHYPHDLGQAGCRGTLVVSAQGDRAASPKSSVCPCRDGMHGHAWAATWPCTRHVGGPTRARGAPQLLAAMEWPQRPRCRPYSSRSRRSLIVAVPAEPVPPPSMEVHCSGARWVKAVQTKDLGSALARGYGGAGARGVRRRRGRRPQRLVATVVLARSTATGRRWWHVLPRRCLLGKHRRGAGTYPYTQMAGQASTGGNARTAAKPTT